MLLQCIRISLKHSVEHYSVVSRCSSVTLNSLLKKNYQKPRFQSYDFSVEARLYFTKPSTAFIANLRLKLQLYDRSTVQQEIPTSSTSTAAARCVTLFLLFSFASAQGVAFLPFATTIIV